MVFPWLPCPCTNSDLNKDSNACSRTLESAYHYIVERDTRPVHGDAESLTQPMAEKCGCTNQSWELCNEGSTVWTQQSHTLLPRWQRDPYAIKCPFTSAIFGFDVPTMFTASSLSVCHRGCFWLHCLRGNAAKRPWSAFLTDSLSAFKDCSCFA